MTDNTNHGETRDLDIERPRHASLFEQIRL